VNRKTGRHGECRGHFFFAVVVREGKKTAISYGRHKHEHRGNVNTVRAKLMSSFETENINYKTANTVSHMKLISI
jgi:hypothetical protein